jgi:16S rRNA G1207 methylase RsmC
MKKRNTAWQITASAPLLRPGLSITIVVSEKYVVEETEKLLEKVREINNAEQTVDASTNHQ